MEIPLRVLIVEDSESDAALIIRELKKAGYSIEEERVESSGEMQEALRNNAWDIVIADYRLPEFDASGALTVLQKSELDLPFIVVSGTIGEETAVSLMKSGAHDYLMKENLARLAPVVQRELSEASLRRAHKRAGDILQESEERYRGLFQDASIGIFHALPEDRFIRVNPAFARMIGYDSPDEMVAAITDIGTQVYVYPGHWAFQLSEASQSHGWLSFENEYRRKDGEVITANLSVRKVLKQDGTLDYFEGFAQDTTEHKRAETKLIESERIYRTLLDASPESVVILDRAGVISDVSNISVDVFGAPDKAFFIGKHFRAFILAEEKDVAIKIVKQTLAEGLTRNEEIRLRKWDGSPFLSELSTTLLHDASGRIRSFILVIRDISERRLMEQQLIHAERMAGLGEIATSIAHEINQPVNTISLGLENILFEISRNQSVDETYLRVKSEKIFENISRIERIIDHIRAFSRDHSEIIYTAFDINESIRNAISLVSEQFKHKGIELTISLDESIPSIIGNTYEVEQVILNLLTNAKDALEEKEVLATSPYLKTVKIKTRLEGTSICLSVMDNGKGIKEEIINKILLPFYSTKEEGKGTGLGLPISFGIVKRMNGTMVIQSIPMDGTTVTVTLPIGNPPKSKPKFLR